MGVTAHGAAADAVLEDGAWHSFEEILTAAGPAIPPGKAARDAERSRRSKVSGEGDRTREVDVVEVGRRSIMRDLCRSRVRHRTWERDGDEFRRVDG